MLEPESEKTNDLASKLYNSYWDWYRLGDTYYKPEGGGDMSYHVEKFPNSIAGEYIKQSSSRANDLDTIKKLVKKDNVLKYDAVIHIRVGDVLCYHDSNFYSAYENKEWWDDLASYFKKNNIQNIYIISGSHTGLCLNKSAQYITNRINFLKNKGFSITFEPGKSPDEDLTIAVNAKNFVSTGGNYGKLMAEMNKSNGGNVLNFDKIPDNLKYILIYFVLNIAVTFFLMLIFSYIEKK